MSKTATMEVQAKPPVMVFMGGYLLPEGSAKVEQSPVQMTICDLTIVRDHPRLPLALRQQFEAIDPKATELPLDLQGPQCFMAIPAVVAGQTVPTLVAMAVRGLKLVRMPAPKSDA